MSKKTPIGLTFFEKVFGLVVLLLGIILVYYTNMNLSVAGALAAYSYAAGGLLIVLGGIMIIVKRK